jgi:hypothetical protein
MRRMTLPMLACLFALVQAESRAVQVELCVQDDTGQSCPARVHLRDALNHLYPGYADSALMSHSNLGGYFYTPGTVVMELPTGLTKILVGRGFEWRPVEIQPVIQSDTSFVIRLVRGFDMRSRGWYSGDTHMHSQHALSDGDAQPDAEASADGAGVQMLGGASDGRDGYPVTPEGVLRVTLAEDLAQSWMLDGQYQFTGGPHVLSTAEAGIYYGAEYINQSYGHISFPGQKVWLGDACCQPPYPCYPMICHIWEGWLPDWDEGLVLHHPHNGATFFDESPWPGRGLGRELPVQAALGRIEALDIVAYTNSPNVFLSDWYRELNCGLDLPPSAGTDALLNSYGSRPAGGYRVYVKEQPGEEHDPAHWVEGLNAGHCFVTDYPLIPYFAVNGVEMGGQVQLPAAGSVQVGFRVECVLPLSSARIIRNGATAAVMNLPSSPAGTVVDTVLTVPVTESCWLALRVDGATTLKHATSTQLFAHTAPVRVGVGGAGQRSTLDSGYFCDWLDSLWLFVELRDNWQYPWQPTEVLARINEARAIYSEAFTEPPEPCGLLAPAWGDTIYFGEDVSFDWTDAPDPEPGDRVCYYLEVASNDSTFARPQVIGPLWESHYQGVEQGLNYDLPYYWRVFSQDRGGNRTLSDPPWMWFYLSSETSDVGEEPPTDPAAAGGAGDIGLLSVWPNPAADRVCFSLGDASPVDGFRFDVLDVCGGCVASGSWGSGAARGAGSSGDPRIRLVAPGIFSWDGCNAAGQRVPSGCYWLRLSVLSPRGTGSAGARQAVKPMLVLR